MIQKEEVMGLLLEACPSFKEKWVEHRHYWEQENLLYVDLSEFARHVLDLHQRHKTLEFSAIFDVVERLHLEGDDFVREATTIGLLESLQNIAGNNQVDIEALTKYLKPESAKWWRELNLFWENKIPYLGSTMNK